MHAWLKNLLLSMLIGNGGFHTERMLQRKNAPKLTPYRVLEPFSHVLLQYLLNSCNVPKQSVTVQIQPLTNTCGVFSAEKIH